MAMDDKKKTTDEPILINHESWWDSVLSDESRLGNSHAYPYPPSDALNPAKTKLTTEKTKSPCDWTFAKDVFSQDQIICMQVVGYNRGGLLVESERLQGFVPYSHLVEMNCETDHDREQVLANYNGQELRLKIIECVPNEGRAVFSERAARVDSGRRTQLFSTIQVGQNLSGQVTNVTDFGVFVDLGGVEGLIHISELSWGRVIHPSHFVSVGQTVEVQVLEIIPERCRIALSLKRLQPNPWENAHQHYKESDVVTAKITSVVSFGVFARLEEGLEGLIHISEINIPTGVSIRDRFLENDPIEVKIIHIDIEHQRLGLSLKLNGD